MTDARFAVLLGVPRSGTTWLQRLLAAHPRIASPQETHLFNNYLGKLHRTWLHESDRVRAVVDALVEDRDPPDRLVGLPTALDEQTFYGLLDAFVAEVVRVAVSAKPDAELVLEKTPFNNFQVDVIRRLRPGARFVHLVRDPRNVVRSLVRAGETWAGEWSPRSVPAAARLWKEHYAAACRAREFGPGQYLELRYEDLRQDGRAQLGRVLEFLDVDAHDDLVDDLLATVGNEGQRPEEFAMPAALEQALAGHAIREPAGFSRARPDQRQQWTPRERAQLESLLGAELRSLGYVTDSSWVDGRPGQLAAARGELWLRSGVKQLGRSVIRRGSGL